VDRARVLASPVEAVDVVLDAVGGPVTVRWLAVLRPGGLLLPTSGADDQLDAAILDQGFRVRRLLVEPDGCGLEALAASGRRGAASGRRRRRSTPGGGPEARRRGEAGHIAGKFVLTVPW
jgi:hypothetical protein